MSGLERAGSLEVLATRGAAVRIMQQLPGLKWQPRHYALAVAVAAWGQLDKHQAGELADLSAKTAAAYCRELVTSGYLEEVRQDGQPAWRLAPMLQDKADDVVRSLRGHART